jgi:hypothetical protein
MCRSRPTSHWQAADDVAVLKNAAVAQVAYQKDFTHDPI